MLRVFADLGNSRLKWGLESTGGLEVVSMSLANPEAWSSVWSTWNPDGLASEWAVSTVNPPVAERLRSFLDGLAKASVRWFRSAADVPIRHDLEDLRTAGADRALGVLGALAARTGPGIVLSCGSAITVDRIGADGVWCGGAIAPGLRLAAEALHGLSTQLPLVHPDRPPPGWGRSTRPALEAGVFWGTVGLIRGLVNTQALGLRPEPWVVWSGGDAGLLIGPTALELPDNFLAPTLVLDGLRAACGG